MHRLAMSDQDNWWQSVLTTSFLGRTSTALHGMTKSWLPWVGSALQLFAFMGLLVLFGVLAMPQFANDKEGLALITLAAAGLWTIGYFVGGDERKPSCVDIPVLAYLAFNAIAAASSHYPNDSLYGLLKLFVYIVAYFFFTATFQQSRRRKYLTIAVLLFAALGVALYGLYQYKIGVAPLATWEDPSVENKGTRIFSTLNNPNLLAGYLLPLVPISAALAIAAFQKKRVLQGLVLSGLAVVFAVSTVLTQSRSAWIALVAGIGIIGVLYGISVWRSHPAKRIWLLILGVTLPVAAVLGLHFGMPSFDQRVASIFAGHEHSSNNYRLKVVESSIQMFKDNWWIGVGPGNKAFVLAYGLYMHSGFDALGTYCVPLEVAVEAGIFALASFICINLAVLARGHLCFWSKQVGIEERWLAAGCSAALVAMMVQGFVDTVFYRPQVQFLFWLLVSLLVTAKIKVRELD